MIYKHAPDEAQKVSASLSKRVATRRCTLTKEADQLTIIIAVQGVDFHEIIACYLRQKRLPLLGRIHAIRFTCR
jgi:hypothetical protein